MQTKINLTELPPDIDVAITKTLLEHPEVLIVDVREHWEYNTGHIPGVIHIPMGELLGRLSEIPKDKTVIMTCQSGERSGQVANYLRTTGYDRIHNMVGGFGDWQVAGYPVDR
jgi:rhodanese-related sulfurtransferase